MTRFASIALLFFYSVSFTEFREVLRLPLLVEHFSEHKSRVTDLSFVEFLTMHYKTDQAHDDTDMRLPFKDCSHSFSAQTVLPIQKMALRDVPEMLALIHESYYLQHKPQVISADIFQPPKI